MFLLSVFLSLPLSSLCCTAECTPEEAFSIVGDNIIFASGSPFKDVDLGMHCGINVLIRS
jgi:hypothetical protein